MNEGSSEGTRGQALFEALVVEQRAARVALEQLVEFLQALAPKQLRQGRSAPGKERIALYLLSSIGPNIPEIARQMKVSTRTLYRMETFMQKYSDLKQRSRRPTGDKDE